MNPFIVFWRAARDVFDELFVMMGANVLWVLIAGPLFVVTIFLTLNAYPIYAAIAALVNVLLLGPASVGLLTMAHRITDGRVAPIGLFFEGARQHYLLSWKVYGLWTLGLVALIFNLAFYAQLEGFFGAFLTVLFIYFMAAWCTLLIYLGPLMLLQEQQRLRLLWRNALVMAFGRPLFTFLTALLMSLIIVLSIVVLILPVILTIALLTVWSMRATIAIITADEQRRLEREQALNPDAAEPVVTEKGRSGQVRSKK
ncbi:MAG: hypothetical protein SH847_26575 [Roseiflexaceae bacterium]|nr:hypothetical protein [Roseiflexaceae bacterium]